jgi:hypothetical protein
MRRRFVFHYICTLLLAVSVALGIYQVAGWLITGDIAFAFSYPSLVLLIALPIGVVTMILFIYLALSHLRHKKDSAFMYAWLLHLVFVSTVVLFFKTEAGKVSIVIRNASNEKIGPLHITARNDQYFHVGMINEGDSVIFKCMCREVVEGDTVGIRASIASRASKPSTGTDKALEDRVYHLAHPQRRPNSSRLVLKVVNDTVARVTEEL